MHRRHLLTTLIAAASLPLLGRQLLASTVEHKTVTDFTPLDHPHDYWRDKVSPEAWRVLFEEATERAGSSPLDKLYEDGTYVCAACHLPLFRSEDKYDSGTGWPSFTQAIPGSMGTKRDFKLVWPRTEYHCIRCGGHQGHVFNDGPQPTGQRWCNNGVALRFVPATENLPALRG
ncbi:MAG: peptide-methionine (R)-S-oxide reductase MsrB [Halopseudomonas yangmingensis]|uniref:peptide-methionine (R)-S-oxide reductase n=1 Tax=Halopseudomonas yangmingensis TaxID=1720063 RepID=A0A1I4S9Q7_9GAMM|nr:peptide-methionine (R)-S-oxide reductase MsrB [Halopseudomonas yangmingensis]SFM61071.1 peptide-methionine (R)-S-oxide reductase [Halopseudomonas yangmingensis]